MTDAIDGDSNDRFTFDPSAMKVFSRDGSVLVLGKAPFGLHTEYRSYSYAIEWSAGVSCFRAQIDDVRDEKGAIGKIGEVGRSYGIAWRDVTLHGVVKDPVTGKFFRSGPILDEANYQAFGRLVVSFLSVNRVLRSSPPVRSISFHHLEHFRPAEIRVA